MDCLPDELLLEILSYLTYPDMGRVVVVNKRWSRLIDYDLLPTVRSFTITGKTKYLVHDGRGNFIPECVKGIDTYRLHSTFRGEPVYISQNKHCLGYTKEPIEDRPAQLSVVTKERLQSLFLYKLDGVWCASAVIGVLDVSPVKFVA